MLSNAGIIMWLLHERPDPCQKCAASAKPDCATIVARGIGDVIMTSSRACHGDLHYRMRRVVASDLPRK